MTDPRTLAQREGPEAMEALVREIYTEGGHADGLAGRAHLIAAARKLAEPVGVEGEVGWVMPTNYAVDEIVLRLPQGHGLTASQRVRVTRVEGEA